MEAADENGWVPTTFLISSEGHVEHINMGPKLLSEPIFGAIHVFRASES